MNFLISFLIIAIGYIFFLLTIGHIILVVRIAHPVTKVLRSMKVLKNDNHTLYTIFCGIIFILVTSIVYFYFNNFLLYLILGYILGIFVIIKNFNKRYSFNKNSFLNWYLKDYYDLLDFSWLPEKIKMHTQDKDNLFKIVSEMLKKKNNNFKI